MDVVWGNAPAPNELHAALRQMSFGKAVGEDKVTAELLQFGGEKIWDVVVRVCREQCLLLTEAAPGAEVVWPDEWCVGLVISLWKHKGNERDKNTWRGVTLLSVGSKLLSRVVASRLRSWFDGHRFLIVACYPDAARMLPLASRYSCRSISTIKVRGRWNTEFNTPTQCLVPASSLSHVLVMNTRTHGESCAHS